MNDREVSPHHEEQIGNDKKLRKREQRLKDRLQEAQLAQANALERLHRAEVRFQKRATRVQHLESRLNLIDQQMRALNAPPSTVVTLITSVSEASAPRIEEQHAPEKAPLEVPAAIQEELQEHVSETSPASTLTATPSSNEDVSREEANAENVVATPVSQPLLHDSSIDAASEQHAEVEIHAEMVAGEAEPQFMERFSAVDATDALDTEEEAIAEKKPSTRQVDTIVMRAREARAVAEAAEQAAYIAIEQAAEVAAYLEQIGSARHLMRELERLDTEANNALALAQETENAALAAERLVAEAEGIVQDEEEPVKLTAEEKQIIATIPTEEELLTESQPDLEPASEEEQEVQAEILLLPETGSSEASPSAEAVPHAHPTPEEIAQVEEIDEEEEVLETVAAMLIADAAAIAAAEAEAVAEASGARTREARIAAQQADLALGAVWLAIRDGALTGEDAEVALKAVERDATRAHALLADAEAAEERDLNTAMNAEAEAEVAEGMAFATNDRTERDEKLHNESDSAHSASANGTAPVTAETEADNDDADLELDDDDDDDDDDDTLKLPSVHPEKT